MNNGGGAGYMCKSVEGLVPQVKKRYIRSEVRERMCGEIVWPVIELERRVVLGLVCLKGNTAATIVES